MIPANGQSWIPLHFIQATFWRKVFLQGSEVIVAHGQLLPQPPTRWSRPLVQHIDLLREVFHAVREQRSFDVDAIVILPDHLHAVLTLPEGDAGYPGRWRAIKSRFSRRLLEQGVKLQRNPRGDYALWQRRYWEHTIRDDKDRQRHVDYIHYNPIKHGHVMQVAEWPHSSFHRFVENGTYPLDWAGNPDLVDAVGFGE